MKHLDIRVILRSLLLKRWHKDAKTSFLLPDLNIHKSYIERELVEMSRYGSLNWDANLMNFYASKVKSSYLHSKEEMARLIATFKEEYENRSISNIDTEPRSSEHRHNPNIIKDMVIVKLKSHEFIEVLEKPYLDMPKLHLLGLGYVVYVLVLAMILTVQQLT